MSDGMGGIAIQRGIGGGSGEGDGEGQGNTGGLGEVEGSIVGDGLGPDAQEGARDGDSNAHEPDPGPNDDQIAEGLERGLDVDDIKHDRDPREEARRSPAPVQLEIRRSSDGVFDLRIPNASRIAGRSGVGRQAGTRRLAELTRLGEYLISTQRAALQQNTLEDAFFCLQPTEKQDLARDVGVSAATIARNTLMLISTPFGRVPVGFFTWRKDALRVVELLTVVEMLLEHPPRSNTFIGREASERVSTFLRTDVGRATMNYENARHERNLDRWEKACKEFADGKRKDRPGEPTPPHPKTVDTLRKDVTDLRLVSSLSNSRKADDDHSTDVQPLRTTQFWRSQFPEKSWVELRQALPITVDGKGKTKGFELESKLLLCGVIRFDDPDRTLALLRRHLWQS